eukprot:SAG25_NODE_2938_length_1306_cov_2.202154_2_plen_74_part_00
MVCVRACVRACARVGQAALRAVGLEARRRYRLEVNGAQVGGELFSGEALGEGVTVTVPAHVGRRHGSQRREEL